jgi:hypothetical protein
MVGPQACSSEELKILLKSTSRLRLSTKLVMAGPIMVSLSSMLVGGGDTVMLKVVVARVYSRM